MIPPQTPDERRGRLSERLAALRTADRKGARAGSLYLILAVAVSGVLTYAFQIMSTRTLGPERYGALATLWSATFLLSQVLWTATMQLLGRHIAEREAHGEGWEEVLRSARRLQLFLLAGFLAVAAVGAVPLNHFFRDWRITVAFVVVIVGYAWAYYKRGLLSGHRQFGRLSLMFVAEAGSRALLAAALLFAGAEVVGPAVGIALAPFFSVWLIRTGRVEPPKRPGGGFSMSGVLAFTGPVLFCSACAQVLANGGPLLISGLGGGDAEAHRQSGLLLAGLILTRAPQYVLSPAIANLLPHLSRLAALGNRRGFERFVRRAAGLVAVAGAALVGGMWLLGEWFMPLFGDGFRLDRGLLTVLAVVASAYILAELLNQVLFARGLARLAAVSWVLGLGAMLLGTWLIPAALLERVSYSLALGTLVTVAALAASHVLTLQSNPIAAGPAGVVQGIGELDRRDPVLRARGDAEG